MKFTDLPKKLVYGALSATMVVAFSPAVAPTLAQASENHDVNVAFVTADGNSTATQAKEGSAVELPAAPAQWKGYDFSHWYFDADNDGIEGTGKDSKDVVLGADETGAGKVTDNKWTVPVKADGDYGTVTVRAAYKVPTLGSAALADSVGPKTEKAALSVDYNIPEAVKGKTYSVKVTRDDNGTAKQLGDVKVPATAGDGTVSLSFDKKATQGSDEVQPFSELKEGTYKFTLSDGENDISTATAVVIKATLKDGANDAGQVYYFDKTMGLDVDGTYVDANGYAADLSADGLKSDTSGTLAYTVTKSNAAQTAADFSYDPDSRTVSFDIQDAADSQASDAHDQAVDKKADASDALDKAKDAAAKAADAQTEAQSAYDEAVMAEASAKDAADKAKDALAAADAKVKGLGEAASEEDKQAAAADQQAAKEASDKAQTAYENAQGKTTEAKGALDKATAAAGEAADAQAKAQSAYDGITVPAYTAGAYNVTVTDPTGAVVFSAKSTKDNPIHTGAQKFSFSKDSGIAYAGKDETAGAYVVQVDKLKANDKGEYETDSTYKSNTDLVLTQYKLATSNAKFTDAYGDASKQSAFQLASDSYSVPAVDAVATADKGYENLHWVLSVDGVAADKVQPGKVNTYTATADAIDTTKQVAAPTLAKATKNADGTWTLEFASTTVGAKLTWGTSVDSKGAIVSPQAIGEVKVNPAQVKKVYVQGNTAAGWTAADLTHASAVVEYDLNDATEGFSGWTHGPRATQTFDSKVGSTDALWSAAPETAKAIESGQKAVEGLGDWYEADGAKATIDGAYKGVYDAVVKDANAYLAQYKDSANVINGDKVYNISAADLKAGQDAVDKAVKAVADKGDKATAADWQSGASNVISAANAALAKAKANDKYTAADVTAANKYIDDVNALAEKYATVTGENAAQARADADALWNTYQTLTDAQREIVPSDTVNKVHNVIVAAGEAEKTQKDIDVKAAAEVQDAVNALKANKAPVQADVDAVKDAYGKLTDGQKKLVKGYDSAVQSAQKIVDQANNPAKPTAKKKSQKLSVKVSKKSVSYKKAKKKAQTAKITVKKAKGKVSFAKAKKSGAYKKVSVSKKGKITFKKGVKKGTYKFTVKAKATKAYKASKAYTVSVKVK